MKLFFDFLPIIIFFVAYKLFNIYVATASAILAAMLQMGYTLLRKQRPDMMQIITLAMIVILGSATLFLKNEMFIKWKPTVVYWILGLVFAGSSIFSSKTLVQKMLEKSLSLPAKAWSTLNISWVSFFFVMGCLNLGVVYFFDTDVWVNFKLFGTLILTFVFVLIQGIMISRYLPKEPSERNSH